MILANIDSVFPSWRFCKVPAGQKGPRYANWQKEGFTWEQVQGSPNAGLLLGPISGGIAAIDIDGGSAQGVLSSWGSVPETATVTSGSDPNRKCLFFLVPQECWDLVETTKVSSGKGAKPEQLEFRWAGAQQIIKGTHPSGSEYRWLVPPQNISTIPNWLLERWMGLLQKEPTKPEPMPVSPGAVSILDLISQPHRRAIETSGTTTGGRNQTGHALYSDLLGVETWLLSQGAQIQDSAQSIFLSWCDSVGLTEDKPKGQPKAIIKSVEKSNPKPAFLQSRSEEDMLKRLRFLQGHRENPNKGSAKPSKVVPIDKDRVPLDIADVQEDLDLLDGTGVIVHDIFPVELANMLEIAGKSKFVDPAAFVLPILSLSGGCLGVHTSCQVVEDWEVYPTIWSAVVAQPGTMKSPILKAVAKPIYALQAEIQKTYEQELDAWNKTPADKRGDAPQRQDLFVDKIQAEGIKKRLCKTVNGGHVSVIKDELAGLFSGVNQYKGGKGDDMAELCKLSDPGPVDHSIGDGTGKIYYNPHGGLTVAGMIQPKTLSDAMRSDPDDATGFWGRWLILRPKYYEYKFKWRAPRINITEALKSLYSRMRSIGQRRLTFRPSEEAGLLTETIVDTLGELKADQGARGRNLLDKSRGHLWKIALVLHCLDAAWAGEQPEQEISAETLKKAWILVQACLKTWEIQARQTWSDPTAKLSTAAFWILDRLQQGSATMRGIRKGRRWKAGELEETLAELQEIGQIRITREGKSDKIYKVETETPPKLEPVIVPVSQPTSMASPEPVEPRPVATEPTVIEVEARQASVAVLEPDSLPIPKGTQVRYTGEFPWAVSGGSESGATIRHTIGGIELENIPWAALKLWE